MGDLFSDKNSNTYDVLKNYSNMVYKLALSQTKNLADAEDVFQEVFLRYVSSNATFESEEHRKAWLIRVTINCSRKLFSSAWFRRTVPLRDEISFESREKSDVFYAVLELPIKYRTVIHLHYYEDFSIAEIRDILGRKESTIKSQLLRARQALKEKLKEDFDYE